MGGRFKGKSAAGRKGAGPIKSGSPSDVLDGLLTFSWKFYDSGNPKFSCQEQAGTYFLTLLDRMKAFSREQVSALTNRKSDSGTRFHRIDFKDDSLIDEEGFGIAKWEQYNDEAWEFSLSANEHGRVHGFIIGNVFYIVWLDPGHRLYSRG